MRDRIEFRETPHHIVYDPFSIPVVNQPTLVWSGEDQAPSVGTRVKIVLNGWKIGGKPTDTGDIPGTIIGYRNDGGWLMAVVECDFVPYWYEAKYNRIGVFAGRELEIVP